MHAGVAPSWKLLRPSIFCARARLRPTSFAAGKNRGGRPTAVAVAAVKTWRGADLTGRALAASIVAAW